MSNEDQRHGVDHASCNKAPLRQIVTNAGEEAAVILAKIIDSKDDNFGYNAAKGDSVI